VREKTWAALRQAIPAVAAGQALFYQENTNGEQGAGSAKYQRNKLFLEAFLAKNEGTYLASIAHDSMAAARSFAEFSRALAALKLVSRPTDLVNTMAWSLGTSEEVGIMQAGSVAQNPVRYLQQPTRPKTAYVGSYFTCAFDAFFVYQLRHEAAQPMPDAQLVQLLDSVAFVEAAYPDQAADTRGSSLQASALARGPAFVPNLVWMRAIRAVPLPLGAARQRRNAFLYTISAALQDSAQLARLQLARDVLPFVRQLTQQPSFTQVPLGVLLSNLATALAHARRGRDAWALAHALPAAWPTISAIRVGEQAMLLGDQRQQASLDSFLLVYQRQLERSPLEAANSVIALLYWRLGQTDQLHSGFRQTVTTIIREGRSSTQEDGPNNMCKGHSLADDSYQAMRDVPVYQSESLRQFYFNTILTGLAHLNTPSPRAGWQEYDDTVLLQPADYDGPAN
jgi:hypothetical protein